MSARNARGANKHGRSQSTTYKAKKLGSTFFTGLVPINGPVKIFTKNEILQYEKIVIIQK